MELLAVVGLLFWIYCAVNVIAKKRYYLSLGEIGKYQLWTWGFVPLGGSAACLWLLLR